MKTTAYDLALKFVITMGDIDTLLDEKSKALTIEEKERIDKEIDRREVELFDLKNKLKSIEV